MDCPKTTLIACFLHLERLKREDKLLLGKGDVEKIITKIKDGFSNFMLEVEKFEESKADTPHPINNFFLCSKSVMGSVNYVKDDLDLSRVKRDKETEFKVITKHELEVDIESFIIESNKVEHQIKQEAEKIILSNSGQESESIVASTSDISILKNRFFSSLSLFCDANDIYVEEKDLFSFSDDYIKLYSSLTNLSELRSGSEFLKVCKIDTDYDNGTVSTLLSSNNLQSALEDKFKDFLGYFKEAEENQLKKFLAELPEIRSGGGIRGTKSVFERNFMANNKDFIKNLETAESFDLTMELKTNDIFNPIITKNRRGGASETFLLKNSIYSTPLDETLVKKIKNNILPDKITINLNNTVPVMEIGIDEEREDVKKIRVCSGQSSTAYSYNSSVSSDGSVSLLAIDESDSGAKGNKSIVARDMAKNSLNVIVATGTGATAGKPQDIGYQQAYSGDIKDVELVAQKYQEQCGVFEIKSSFTKKLFLLLNTNRGAEETFKSKVIEYQNLKKDKAGANLAKIADELVKTLLQHMRNRDDLGVDDINVYDAGKDTTNILKAFLNQKIWLKVSSLSGSEMLKRLLFDDANNSGRFVKSVAGISSIKNYTSMIKSFNANPSITNREILTGKKETISFVDSMEYHATRENIAKRENLEELADSNILYPKAVEAYLSLQASMNYTREMYYFLVGNFQNMIDSIEGRDDISKKNLQEILPRGVEAKDFIYSISKSGTSTEDDIVSLYSQYLKNNGDINAIQEDKRELLGHVIDVFEKIFIDKYLRGKEPQQYKKFEFSEIYLPEKFSNIFGDDAYLAKEFYFENGYPNRMTASGLEPIKFSTDVVLKKESLKDVQGSGVLLRLSLVDLSSKDVIDLFTSKGRDEEIRKAIERGINFILPTSRVAGSVNNILSSVVIADNRSNPEKPIAIHCVKNSEVGAIVKNIKENSNDFLERNNKSLEAHEANAIANQVKKADSKGIQYAVAGSYIALARGLDLSETSLTICSDALEKSQEFIQLMARSYNPSKDKLHANIMLFNGGKDCGLTIPTKNKNDAERVWMAIQETLEVDENGYLILDDSPEKEAVAREMFLDGSFQPKPTYSNLINSGSMQSYLVYKGAMGGTLSDTKQTNVKNILEYSDMYASKIRIETGIDVNSEKGRDYN